MASLASTGKAVKKRVCFSDALEDRITIRRHTDGFFEDVVGKSYSYTLLLHFRFKMSFFDL